MTDRASLIAILFVAAACSSDDGNPPDDSGGSAEQPEGDGDGEQDGLLPVEAEHFAEYDEQGKPRSWNLTTTDHTPALTPDPAPACGEPHTITIEVPTAGEHLVEFSMREDDFEFDEWLMTTDGSYVPEGAGPDENVRQ